MTRPSAIGSSTARDRLAGALDRLSRGFQRRIAIDLRGLAALRIALGALLILDLLLRARDLSTFYTDDGVLPLEALFADYSSVYSLHALSGEAWVQALLFLVAGVFALALLVGYRTRIATIVSWLLLLSLHVRNPMILHGGDVLLRMLLFWSIFLPLGERWSIDARRLDRDRTTVASIGTMALLAQVVLMYVVNAVHKTRGDLWMEGEAVVHTFQADQYTYLLGPVLADHHALLGLFGYAWMGLLLLAPLLVVLTGVRRTVFTTLFVGMHLGMFVTIRIDVFPLIVVAALLAFYPPVFWDGAIGLATRVGIADRLRVGLERLQRTAPTLPASPLSSAARAALPSVPNRDWIRATGRTAFQTVVPWFFLVLVVLSNAQAVDYAEVPDPAEEVLETVEADQDWQLFAPEPVTQTRWLVVPGQLADGTEIDLRDGTDVSLDRPPNVDQRFDTSRERKYLASMRSTSNENHRSYYASYLCERWNADHDGDEELESLTIYGMTDTADLDDEEPDVSRYTLLEYDCSGAFVQNE
ncbi:HTTM domain-containing protein [Halopiger goleimassiliensis]|uniref:HTTM domain-containing protein n=1 Tax=Halopiger goleimassiliensis TaxID=1293048 RepID=UPI000677FEA5|nr:HTTM domain-containing protein [Halopiger goleimassiliensis]